MFVVWPKPFWPSKKIFARLILGFIIAALLLVLADAVFVYKFPKRALPRDQVDAVVVLGAAINSRAVFNRTIKGLRLYEQGKGEMLVLTGGRTSDMDETEAHYMGRVVNANAVRTPRVALEELSQNTWENLHNTKTLLPEVKSVLIVSDTYHLPRAVLVAKKAGFTEVFWDSPSQYYYSDQQLRWYYLREMAALIDYLPRLAF